MIPLDVTKPNIARIYDYWLGGKDNFEADREAAEAIRQRRPNVADQALDNKKFQTRAISYVARQGVRQFLDIGSGLPTSPVRAEGAAPLWLATHEAARAVAPDAMVGYVDYDPVAVAHSQALLARGSTQIVAVDGDMCDPGAILAHEGIRRAGFSLDAPACVILCCVLHFLDPAAAKGVASTFAWALVPGSYMIISLGFGKGDAGREFASTYNAQDGPRIYAHSWEDISALVRRPGTGAPRHRGLRHLAGRARACGPGRPELDDPGCRRPPPLNGRPAPGAGGELAELALPAAPAGGPAMIAGVPARLHQAGMTRNRGRSPPDDHASDHARPAFQRSASPLLRCTGRTNQPESSFPRG